MSFYLPTRTTLIKSISILFPAQDRDLVLSLLDEYDTGPWLELKEHIQLAILILSEGDIEKLKHFLDETKRDYRNVLYWSEYTKPGPPDGTGKEDEREGAGVEKEKAKRGQPSLYPLSY